jgi:pimeloyl-ACP methyl ester carboxylesterase
MAESGGASDATPRYEDEIAQGELASAVVTAMKGLCTEPLFRKMPRWLLAPLMALIMKVQGRHSPVSIRALIRTMHFDMCIVREMPDTLSAYRSLNIPTLLLGGGKSPQYLREALCNLASILPHAKQVTFHALGHDGPENDGKPDPVAEALRKFLHGKVEPASHCSGHP